MGFKGLVRPNGLTCSVEEACKRQKEFGLPAGLLRGLAKLYDGHRKADVSVTELVDPPQISVLKERHDYHMAPRDMIWAVLGTATHQIIAEGADPKQLAEEFMVTEFDGVKISGTADLYDPADGGVIWDFKTTKVYAVKNGVKPEWEAQMNLYALLSEKNGRPVKKLKLVALLKDWAAWSAKKGGPQSEIHVMDVELWPKKKREEYLRKRIALWKENRERPDDKLDPCSPEETWGGRRCSRYCSVALQCRQYQASS